MGRTWLQALLAVVVFSAFTGIVYPLAVTGLAQLCCQRQSNGSLIERQGQLIGSKLLGQPFDQPRYFWSRPSATTPQPYNGVASSGSNLGPTNPAQLDAVKARVAALQQADPGNRQPIPVDLVTASASGLDPEISPAAAAYQIGRVARVRALAPDRLRALVAAHTEGRLWGIFGEPRVNVLELNLALDATH